MTTFEIGVGDLVTEVLRSGNIDSRSSGKARMHEGSLIHRTLQEEDSEKKENYQSEVYFERDYEYEGYNFRLSGRADAIYTEDGKPIIEEIKTTRKEGGKNFTEDRAHRAQLRFYGLFYLLENGLDEIDLRLRYYHVKSETSTYFDEKLSLAELKAYAGAILSEWLTFGRLEEEWIKSRNETIKEVPFVFKSFRKGQREMSLAVYNTIKRRDEVLIEAPTGIGKTAATLFPAIKALLLKNDQIYYLTAKTTIQNEARKALDKMRELGLKIRSTTITAKDKICFLNQETPGSRNCNPDDCPYAKKYFDKINDVLRRTLSSKENFTREEIEKIARENGMCPYQLSHDLAHWSDIVICDYNYVFDPLVTTEFSNRNSVYLIDEAHNLTDRARSMYSTDISKSALKKLYDLLEKEEEEVRNKGRNFRKHIRRTISFLEDLRDEMEKDENVLELDDIDLDELSGITVALQQASSWFNMKLEKDEIRPSPEFMEVFNDVINAVSKFNYLSEFYEDNTFCFYLKREWRDIRARFACLDPSRYVSETIGENPAILFSATLTPFEYYKEILLASKDVPSIAIPSPFKRENYLVLYDDSISTRYNDREESYRLIAERIKDLIYSKKGHYIVFFPSYTYLKETLGEIEEIVGEDYEIITQKADMNDKERNAFIDRFKNEEKPLLGLCVMGGVFSEGLDLPFDSLIGTIIIGPGLPGIDYERDLLKDYFEELNDHGYAYAYAYPGMNRVLQSAGRVIRTEEDKGVIILIDDRFGSRFYNKMIPEHLKPERLNSRKGMAQRILKDFWSRQ